MKRLAVTAAIAALALSTSVMGIAAPAMTHGKMMHGKMMSSSKMVYVCKMCKDAYSPAQAKAMNYKDPMGHTLVKMSKVPAGYALNGKMMKNGKM